MRFRKFFSEFSTFIKTVFSGEISIKCDINSAFNRVARVEPTKLMPFIGAKLGHS